MFLNSAKSLKKYPHRTLKAYNLNLTLKAVRLLAGVITEQQGKSVSQLLATEVVSLQELFHTQMGCICSPCKTLNPREKPLSQLWKKPSRTRNYLESLGLREILHENQMVVICPKNCQLLNILSLFHGSIE